MRISTEDIKKIAKDFLNVLDSEGIISYADLEGIVDETLRLGNSRDFVTFLLRPSNFGTLTHTVSYVRPGAGIPIEFTINGQLDYSKVIVKFQGRIEGYYPFRPDVFGNIAQYKAIKGSDFSLVRGELQALQNLK